MARAAAAAEPRPTSAKTFEPKTSSKRIAPEAPDGFNSVRSRSRIGSRAPASRMRVSAAPNAHPWYMNTSAAINSLMPKTPAVRRVSAPTNARTRNTLRGKGRVLFTRKVAAEKTRGARPRREVVMRGRLARPLVIRERIKVGMTPQGFLRKGADRSRMLRGCVSGIVGDLMRARRGDQRLLPRELLNTTYQQDPRGTMQALQESWESKPESRGVIQAALEKIGLHKEARSLAREAARQERARAAVQHAHSTEEKTDVQRHSRSKPPAGAAAKTRPEKVVSAHSGQRRPSSLAKAATKASQRQRHQRPPAAHSATHGGSAVVKAGLAAFSATGGNTDNNGQRPVSVQ